MEISKYNGQWSPAALVVCAIAEGGAAKLAIVTGGFSDDVAWAKAMEEEMEHLLRRQEDMAMLIVRLARRLRMRSKTMGDQKAAEGAVAFLTRHGLQGSPLR